jgi:PKD repeat protein
MLFGIASAQTPVAAFSGMPRTGQAPLNVTFMDQSTGSPTGWAWYLGDENFTAPWTQVNASAGWIARDGHSSVVMPDGSIVLMGGYSGVGPLNDVWRSTDNGTTWMQVNASAGWTARYNHIGVVMPDGSIVLMGGEENIFKTINDVWRSMDNGATWTQVNASAGWTARFSHSSVVMPDGSIVLMGGRELDSGSYRNDVWRSTDNGTTWMQVNASAGWTARYSHSSVVMPDGRIVLMGGYDSVGSKNDVWQSMDNGATWMQVNASAGWTAGYYHSSVVMPDGSIVLMGGYSDSGGYKNDVWRSMNNGTTWTQVNASAGWTARDHQKSVVMPDGSIVLMGGYNSVNPLNDVWRLMPAGSSAQNPSHTYTVPGTYQVALQVYNADGYTNIQKPGYIIVTTPSPAPIANFTANVTTGFTPLAVKFTDTSTGTGISAWNWDFNNDGAVDSTVQSPEHIFNSGMYTVNLTVTGTAGSDSEVKTNYIMVIVPTPTPTPIPTIIPPPIASFTTNITSGPAPLTVRFNDTSSNTPAAWNWSFRNVTGNNTQVWFNTAQNPSHIFGVGNYFIVLNASNSVGYNLSTQVTFINVTANTSTSMTKIGIYNGGNWYMDYNGDGQFIPATGDKYIPYGATGWTQVVGDWNGDGKSEIGIYKDGVWYLDYDGSGTINANTKYYSFGGPGWTPLVGDWNADKKDEIGVYNAGNWYLDYDGTGVWSFGDRNYGFGTTGWIPVTGKWTSDGYTKIGIYNGGNWYMDYNGDGQFIPATGDKYIPYGATGWTQVVGDWNGDGKSEIGISKDGVWYLDYDGSGTINANTKYYSFGGPGLTPLVGDWNADTRDEIGVYQDGNWHLDYDGTGVWSAGDRSYGFGTTGWTPVVGKWG